MNKLTAVIATAITIMATPSIAQDISAKSNAYIQCYNGISGRAIDSINRYNSWVKDPKAGPTGKERVVYGLYTLNDSAVKNCKENVTAAIAAEPKAEALDKAAEEYLKATIALDEKIIEADRYYSRENYKDDDFAKGKEMHKPLVAAMDAFIKANDALGKALDDQSSNAMGTQLAEIEKAEGKSFNYWMLFTMIESKSAVELMSQEKFDVEKAKKLIASYEEGADKLIDGLKADESLNMKYLSLPMRLDDFRVALKERMRRVRDNTPYSTGEKMNLNPGSGWMVKGSPYKVTDMYNKVIQEVNR
ncbi:MAG: YiiG family protein [Gammaproteobacteria bacterium]|nr:YiiG family protein [Gammaproteobacteria bacterium]